MPDNFWQSNAQGAAILNDAGINPSQLSVGSYGRLIDTLENGGSFTFKQNNFGEYDVVTDKPKNFWNSLISGSNSDFLSSLGSNSYNTSENSNQKESSVNTFLDYFKGMFKTLPIIGPTVQIADAAPDIKSGFDAIEKRYIRIGIFAAGIVFIAIGLVFLFKDSATSAIVGQVKNAIKD